MKFFPFSVVIFHLFLLSSLLFSPSSTALNVELVPALELGKLSGFKASELCTVAENTQSYLTEQTSDSFAVHQGEIFQQFDDTKNITLERVKETLAFICQTYREDVRAKRQSRLHQADFIKQHFDFYRWLPDVKNAQAIANKSTNEVKSRLLNNIPEDEIFLTKYYTKLLTGSDVQTKEYSQALYALPFDEQALSLEQADAQKNNLTRYKYTRQQIIAGVLLEKNLAKPLVWVTEEALHDVLLQGTGVLKVNGSTRYFNVHRNNGIAYDYHIGKREQARYWYFAEVPSIMGYGQSLSEKIAIKPHVTFAGNVLQLGLGKLVMVSYKAKQAPNQQPERVSRMGVLADQGGAFDNNLFQLDLLVDSYQGWQDYHQANKNLPDYAQAWFMLKK